MSDRKYATHEAMYNSFVLVATKLESMDQRIERRFQALEQKVDAGFAAVDARFTALEGMLSKILEGQAILMQNEGQNARRIAALERKIGSAE